MVYQLEYLGDFQEAFSTPLGACFGITPFNNGLALSVQTSAAFMNTKWQIQYVDSRGNVLRRIQNNSDGKAHFEEPLNIASNRNRNVLFVSDNGGNGVFAFDVMGNLLFHYHGISVRSPLGIAAEKFDNVYVACGKKVIQVKKGGEKSRELALDIKDKVVSVCMAPNSDTLTVISQSGHIVSFNYQALDSV